MITAIRRWLLKRELRRTPHHELVEQHEMLIRLARRCAYDFAHAVDGIPEGHWFRTALEMHTRPHHWQSIFSQGNPGKDYRMKVHHQIWDLEQQVEKLEKFIQANGLEMLQDPDAIPF